ncbi:rabenosyn-5 [Lucilia sericata]|uniref:rabenosyn-5 n=1 Tax=Lucilia sericata TaxID=13632 RepID=UPI0018A86C02|nr:rabenosyn-5 [Lucilia sericata]
MSNPFGEPDESDIDGAILEGFICPICREDLKSLEFLTDHFDKAHAEDDDLRTLFKDIFSKAKKKINFDLSRNLEKNATISNSRSGGEPNIRETSNARSRMNVFNFMDHQEVGVEQSLTEYFQSIRNPRLERYASETNKLIIRLHKLLKDMPSDAVLRKQHEQNIVPWLDGSSVKLCPNCAKSFHIARRQHHCRLCGSIMCHDCSKFLPLDTALELASLTMTHSEPLKQTADEKNATSSSNPQQSGIRSCDHCLWLLETRQEMHESRTCRPPITHIYADIQKLRKNVMPDIEMYLKIIASLYEGESIFTLNDASALRGKIGQVAEAIDVLSKRILAISCEPGTREESLKKAIRLSCIQLIKEKMLSLPPLPKEEEIRKIQERKRMEAELRIATERRQAMEAYERYGLAAASSSESTSLKSGDYAQGSDLRSLDNWTAHQISTAGLVQSDDPLVEQINIIKGYIKQARQDMNFDVVETLEINLRELQKEFYQRQRALSVKHNNTATTQNNEQTANLDTK